LLALLFTANAILMALPPLPGMDIQWWTFLWYHPSVLPRWVHLLLSALAFSGLYLALLGLWHMRRGRSEEGYWLFRLGLGWFLIPTLVQFTVGSWLLWSLAERADFLGARAGHTCLLLAGIVTSLAGFVLLLASRGALYPTRWAGPGAACMFVSAGLMVLVQDTVRRSRLEGYYETLAGPATAQWSPFWFFVLVLLLGLATVAAMLWICFRLPFQPRLQG
jgi:hypothetical protein